jgi:hypothetical protein
MLLPIMTTPIRSSSKTMIVTLFSTSHSRSLSNGLRWIRPRRDPGDRHPSNRTRNPAPQRLPLARLIDDNGHTQAVIALEDIHEELVREVMGLPGGQTLQTKSTVSDRRTKTRSDRRGLSGKRLTAESASVNLDSRGLISA